jgi:solute:Na+ symporter, SSS family
LTVSLVVLAIYALALMGLGLWTGRRVLGASDFLVAGRRLGPGLILSTMLAANIGSGATVGATSAAYLDGLASWWWVGSAALGCGILALWLGPALRRVAAAHDLSTVGEYLEFRYDERVRGVISALLWTGSLFMLASQLIGLGWVLEAIGGVPAPIGCAMGALAITLYLAAGGLVASAWVGVVQLAVKLIGFAIAVPIAIAWFGGWSEVSAVRADDVEYWQLGGGQAVKYLALLVPAFAVSPTLLQKIFGARDDRAIRLGVGLNALGLLLFAGVPVVLGIIARQRFPGIINSPELALPMVFTYGVPGLAGAVVLAAIFSAELSAAEAVLFMLSASLSQDLYKRFINRAADETHVLAFARLVTVASGALALGLALLARDLVQTLELFYALLGVALFVPVVAGLYVRRTNADAALAAILGGVGGLLVAQGASDGTSFGLLAPAPAGLLCAVLGWLISMIFTPKPASKPR